MDPTRRNDRQNHGENCPSPKSNGNIVTNLDRKIEQIKDQLSLADQSKFEGSFPAFQLPKFVGSFSLNEKRDYLDNHSQLRYLVIPHSAHLLHNGNWKVNLDLRKGVKQTVEKDGVEIRKMMLDDMLRWIIQERINGNKDIFKSDQSKQPLESEFVCFRGILTLIMQTPYERRDRWVIAASKFQGTIYLWELQELYASVRDNTNDPRAREISLWGFKFEQYLCADSPSSVPNPKEALNTNAEFCCVVKTQLAGRPLLYGAELDALRPDSQPPWESETPTLKSFVELKTTRQIENEKQDANFRKNKLRKWWAQSFLVGIPSVICGFRNDWGLVTKMEEFEVKKLHQMGQNFWKPKVMMNFCDQFLDFVQSAFPDESLNTSSQEHSGDPTLHYIFEFDPKRKIVSRRLGNLGSDFSRKILPDWYIEAMSQPIG